MNIKTDHKWKNLLYGYELTEKEKLEFDYLNEEDLSSDTFIRYKGQIYHMDQFMCVTDTVGCLRGWHGYYNDSFFSGIIIKVSNDGEQYMIATFTQ